MSSYNKNFVETKSNKPKHFVKLMDLVNFIKGVNWNYVDLAYNRNIYLEDIETKMNELEENNSYKFDKYWVSHNPNLTIEFVKKHLNEDEKDKIVKRNHKDYWNWDHLSNFFSFNIIKYRLELCFRKY
jgi:hypothetical protein